MQAQITTMPSTFLDTEGDSEQVLSLKEDLRNDHTKLMTPDRVRIITKSEVFETCRHIREAFEMGVFPGRILAEPAIDMVLPFLGGEMDEAEDLRQCAVEVICSPTWHGKMNTPEENILIVRKFSSILQERILPPGTHRTNARLLANTMAHTPTIAAQADAAFLLNCTDLCHAADDRKKDELKLASLKAYYDANKNDVGPCQEIRLELGNRYHTVDQAIDASPLHPLAAHYHRRAAVQVEMINIMNG